MEFYFCVDMYDSDLPGADSILPFKNITPINQNKNEK